ncbi:tetratricopeptide repeat protein [Baaleninema sp.]|uniref:tetratricopeptide repeat protein n=1 Tax=Baaleninema sp. TaxID=3101197 RepID=UPI003D08DAC2
MAKLVVLELIGNSIDGGFDSILEIGEAGERPQLRERGKLPANPALQAQLQAWQDAYSRLGPQRRLKPKSIEYRNARDRCRDAAAELERQFQKWLASESFREIDRRLRETLNPGDEIRLAIASDQSELRKLPWHLWDFCRRYPNIEATFAPLTGIAPMASPQSDRDPTLKILAILGNDEGIDIESDRRFLESLAGAEVTFLVSPQRQAIHDRLWEKHWDIIFFAGHSETREGEGFLAAFSRGKGFHASVREARERLQGMEDRFPCNRWLPAIVQHPNATPPVWRRSPLTRYRLPGGKLWRKIAATAAVAGVAIALNGWGRNTLGGWLHRQGWNHYRAERQDAAEDWWRWTLRVDPQRRATLLMLGHLYERAGDEAAAEELYQQAARRGLPVAYRKLAQLRLRRGGDVSTAVVWAEQGLALLDEGIPAEKSGREELLTTLAWARCRQGSTAEATTLLEEVLASPKEVVAARCLYGAIWSDRGFPEEARAFWQVCAAEANPLDPDEERWRERALRELAQR